MVRDSSAETSSAAVRSFGKSCSFIAVAEVRFASQEALSAATTFPARFFTGAAAETNPSSASTACWHPTPSCARWGCARGAPSGTWANLLVNTGLMLFDLREPWVDGLVFSIRDFIQVKDGVPKAFVEPEDWRMSRYIHSQGYPVRATRAVELAHYGSLGWTNQWQTDEVKP